MPQFPRFSRCLALMVSVLSMSQAHAATISGGTLLTQSYAGQIEAWLGTNTAFTNIYSQGVNDTSLTWHAAVDGQGPTVTLIQTDLGLLGGYNPVSWGSVGDYYFITNDNVDRTAFIFNLSTSVLQRQKLDSLGAYQTYNGTLAGPTFGGGYDLGIVTALSSGYVNPFSYTGGDSLNLLGGSGRTDFSVTKIETFTLSQDTAAPEPATWLLAISSIAAIVLLHRRRTGVRVPPSAGIR